MSQAAVTEVLNRAKTDEKFRQQLLADPANTLRLFDLTTTEIKMISALDEDDLKGGNDSDGFGVFIPGGGG